MPILRNNCIERRRATCVGILNHSPHYNNTLLQTFGSRWHQRNRKSIYLRQNMDKTRFCNTYFMQYKPLLDFIDIDIQTVGWEPVNRFLEMNESMPSFIDIARLAISSLFSTGQIPTRCNKGKNGDKNGRTWRCNINKTVSKTYFEASVCYSGKSNYPSWIQKHRKSKTKAKVQKWSTGRTPLN